MFSSGLTASHEVELLQEFVRLVVRTQERGLIDQLPDLGGVHVAGPLDVDGAANLVHAAISSWVVLVNLLHKFWINVEVLENGVQFISISIFNIVAEHQLDLI